MFLLFNVQGSADKLSISSITPPKARMASIRDLKHLLAANTSAGFSLANPFVMADFRLPMDP
jgi:hypothetical protein